MEQERAKETQGGEDKKETESSSTSTVEPAEEVIVVSGHRPQTGTQQEVIAQQEEVADQGNVEPQQQDSEETVKQIEEVTNGGGTSNDLVELQSEEISKTSGKEEGVSGTKQEMHEEEVAESQQEPGSEKVTKTEEEHNKQVDNPIKDDAAAAGTNEEESMDTEHQDRSECNQSTASNSSSSSGDTEPVPPSNNEDKMEYTDQTEDAVNSRHDRSQESDSEVKPKKTKSSSSSDSEEIGRGRPWRTKYTGRRKVILPRLNRYSSEDTKDYREGYPGKEDDLTINENYKFYTNQIPSYPQGDFIDRIHENWWGDYGLLEYHHSYIQWLFPIRERGLNWHAKELQRHEIDSICENPDAMERVVKSYEMMLDFYGLKLEDPETGEVKRSDNWQERFRNLNRSGHNYLRITRILKCLGELGLDHYMSPLIRHLLEEAIIERTLENTLSSCINYWIAVVKDDKERADLMKLAQEYADKANEGIE